MVLRLYNRLYSIYIEDKIIPIIPESHFGYYVCLEAAPGFPPPVLECLCLFHFTRNSYSANVLLVQCLRYGLWFTSNNQRWLGDEDDPAKRYVALEERTQPQVHVVKDLGVDERALVDHEHRL